MHTCAGPRPAGARSAVRRPGPAPGRSSASTRTRSKYENSLADSTNCDPNVNTDGGQPLIGRPTTDEPLKCANTPDDGTPIIARDSPANAGHHIRAHGWPGPSNKSPSRPQRHPWPAALGLVGLLWLALAGGASSQVHSSLQPSNGSLASSSTSASNSGPIIIDHHQLQQAAPSAAELPLAAHLQPSSLLVAHNKSINFTHLALDELTGSIYVGATNWLFQLSGAGLRPEWALKTGPSSENSRDCSPADCHAQLQVVSEPDQVPLRHLHPALDLRGSEAAPGAPGAAKTRQSLLGVAGGPTMHMLAPPVAANGSSGAGPARRLAASPQQVLAGAPAAANSSSANQQNNNYNKILAIDYESRQLLVCGSLNQGACRRHQLGNLSNFSDIIPLPVASNDEHSSSVALITRPGAQASARQQQPPVLYVAATNSRLGPYREMVPAISARHLEPASRAMQIIERSFTDSARVDISYELRDYYLVNYVHAFQWNEHVYFATVQRKSPLRQLEEWGYITRLARLCLSDLSFQSYTEMTLECSGPSPGQANRQPGPEGQPIINYNLLQDAHLIQSASVQLLQQLGVRQRHASGGPILVGSFAQSRDHTTKSSSKSAICLFPLDRIEQQFNDNINLCYNGSSKARNMNYIAGSVNDCPKAGRAQPANYCSEPIKLNGSLALISAPVISFDDELITSIAATQANTSPLGAGGSPAQRSHQVLLAGTHEGRVKKIVLLPAGSSASSQADEPDHQARPFAPAPAGQPVIGHQFDSFQLDELRRDPILADMLLVPTQNPQLTADRAARQAAPTPARLQFVVAATAHKLAKVPVNTCRQRLGAARQPQQAAAANNQSAQQQLQLAHECQACAQLADPFCGWCATLGACSSRDECAAASQPAEAHWQPLDGIRCAHYQPLVPQFVALEGADQQQQVEVNLRLGPSASQLGYAQLAAQLARAQFACHFDFGPAAPPRPSGATTKASRARLNAAAGTLAVGCPLPGASQRPAPGGPADQRRVKLTVRLAGLEAAAEPAQQQQRLAADLEQVLANGQQRAAIERELTFYDCSAHTSCGTCLDSGAAGRRWACAWCPVSGRCTFNASHTDFGCAASALGAAPATTPRSAGHAHLIRGAQLAASLDPGQLELLNVAIEQRAECPAEPAAAEPPAGASSAPSSTTAASALAADQPAGPRPGQPGAETLVAHESRKAVQVTLRQPIGALVQQQAKRVTKLECLLDLEGSRARLSARLADQQTVVCQESLFAYQAELATQRAHMHVILNENQVIESLEVTLYKCHLFGISPPALASSLGGAPAGRPSAHQWHHQSSAAWRPLEQLAGAGSARALWGPARHRAPSSADCSMCASVARKFQCAWCSNRCQHADQCQELAASTCPPPRIDSIHPKSGPLEGGTLLTIEGSNLGSNEREIQHKISVAGEPCQLVMYSVSTRIVCKTGPSPGGAQAATVSVGNRAGVTSAQEMFHYKAVHLTDVNPRIGPVSGGTRLQLTGSNLNVGSRIHIYLDDIPCALDSSQHELTSHQISCITGPNLLAASPMRISKLTLLVDNSTHQLPYPFTYHPDPIITAIEPAESFLSGGRLVLISGQHLAAPQSIRLMVYHEHRHNVLNATTCIAQNDTLVTCLTPGVSRELLAGLAAPADQQQLAAGQPDEPGPRLAYEPGAGLRLRMMLIMDDVKSTRNLDEYYHHLPQHLTYFEDPQLFRLLPHQLVDYAPELLIQGEQLAMRQLDQDMLITIGAHVCQLKSVQERQVVCEPPAQIGPVYDELGRLVERPVLAIVGLIGSHLRYPIGHMRYSSSQYQLEPQASAASTNANANLNNNNNNNNNADWPAWPLGRPPSSGPALGAWPLNSEAGVSAPAAAGAPPTPAATLGLVALVLLGLLGFLVAFSVTFVFAMSRFRRSKAEREYKRIQLQMGSLDMNQQLGLAAQPFDNKLHLSSGLVISQSSGGFATAHSLQQPRPAPSIGSRAIDYVGSALAGKRPFYQFGAHQHQQPAPVSFSPSPMTDISSLVGLGAGPNRAQHQQHMVRLASDGQSVVSSAKQPQPAYYAIGGSVSASSSSQVSPNSSSATSRQGAEQHQHQQQQLISLAAANGQKCSNLLTIGQQHQPRPTNGASKTSRDFNWTQEAPSTIVPYAVIEACNLTLEGKNAIREFV